MFSRDNFIALACQNSCVAISFMPSTIEQLNSHKLPFMQVLKKKCLKNNNNYIYIYIYIFFFGLRVSLVQLSKNRFFKKVVVLKNMV